jgi:FlaA1/EpsC-like NDP-sugar epimerase
MLSLAFWLAFMFRFEFAIPHNWLKVALTAWPYVVAIEYAVLAAFGVPRISWRYVSMSETMKISAAISASTVLLVIVGAIMRSAKIELLDFAFLPRGVLASNLVLALVGLVGIRATRRVWGESQERKQRSDGGELARVLLIGAGQAGVMVAREIANRPDLGLLPVGFIDDDPHKLGTQIGGLQVLGGTNQIANIAARKRATRALITIANAPGSDIRRITLLCSDAGLQTRIIPGIYEIVGEHVNLSRIREVAIEDLLGREPVKLDEESILQSVQGKL